MPYPSTPKKKPLIQGQQEFAFSLYPLLDNNNADTLFSPYAIATNLSMLFMGARGTTRDEMDQLLHIQNLQDLLPDATQTLLHSLLPAPSKEPTYQLSLINQVWIDKQTMVLANFRFPLKRNLKEAGVGSIF